MTRLLSVAMLLIVVTGCSNSQPSSKGITWDIQKDVDALIPNGEISIDVMDRVTSSPRRRELMEKAALALQQHPEVFQELKGTKVGDPGRWEVFEKLGFTKQEFEEFERILDKVDDVTAHSSGTEKVVVTREGGKITFEAGPKIDFLNDLVIDPENNVVMMGERVLAEVDTFTVSNTNNAFKTTWKGYSWHYSKGNPQIGSPEEMAKVNAEIYTVVLGYFDKDGKTYLEVRAKEIRNGQLVVNYTIPMVFKN